MPELEKRAWFQLAVAGVTALAWFAVFAIFWKPEVAMAAFALFALTGWPGLNPKRSFHDERDRAIAGRSLSIALRTLFAVSVFLSVALGLILGWEHTLSFTTSALVQVVCVASIAVVTVESAATIVQYRQDRHA
jgi:hypothetical protein